MGVFEIVSAGTYPADSWLVFDLEAATGQAVRVAELYPDMAQNLRSDKRSYDFFKEGQRIVTRDNAVVEVAPSDADDYHFENSGGTRFYAVPRRSAISLHDVGLSGNEKTEIGDTLRRIWNFFADQGGTIYIPEGHWRCENIQFRRSSRTVRVVAHPSASIQPSDPRPGTFMWDFLSEGSVTNVELESLRITGPIARDTPREAFNGIRVGSSNYLRVIGCHGRFVKGTALKLVRNHNSVVDLRTFKCGCSESGRFALHVTGDEEADAAFNDVRISGTSEQDQLGWLFEAGTLLLGTERLKLHGRRDGKSMRVLQIHRVSSFDLAVETTLGWSGTSMVHVSDAGSGDGVVLQNNVPSSMRITRGNLDIKPLHTLQPDQGGQGSQDMLTVDLATPGSALTVTGTLTALARSPESKTDYALVGLAAPGNRGVHLDLTGLKVGGVDRHRLLDDRRTDSRTLTLPVMASPALILERSATKTTPSTRVGGQIVGASWSGSGLVPPVDLLGVTYEVEAGGTKYLSPWNTITATVPGRIRRQQRVVTGQRPLVGEDADGRQSRARLSRATIGLAGLEEEHDRSNHWVLDVYLGTDLAQSLRLTLSETSSAPSDGLASFTGGNTQVGYCLDYWHGLADIHYDANNFFGAILRPVGRPRPVADLSAQFSFTNVT